MQRNKSCDQNRGTGLKAETNPDINVKLERGKCETVRFSLTVRDYKSFFFLHGKCRVQSRIRLEINLSAKMAA